jgi:hypothetical protein
VAPASSPPAIHRRTCGAGHLVAGLGCAIEDTAQSVGLERLAPFDPVAAPRIFMEDTPEDHAAIQPVLSQVNFYPLSQFDGTMKATDWSKLPHIPAPSSSGKGETQ